MTLNDNNCLEREKLYNYKSGKQLILAAFFYSKTVFFLYIYHNYSVRPRHFATLLKRKKGRACHEAEVSLQSYNTITWDNQH